MLKDRGDICQKCRVPCLVLSSSVWEGDGATEVGPINGHEDVEGTGASLL